MKGHGVATPEERLAKRRAGQREYDRKKRRRLGRPEFHEAECGTRSGYNKHLKEGTEICQPCRDANAKYRRDRRNGVNA